MKPHRPSSEVRHPAAPTAGGRGVLVVDPVSPQESAVAEVIAVAGLHVVAWAPTAAAAWKALRTPAAERHLALVLVDLDVADGGGAVFARELAARCIALPVVLVSTRPAADVDGHVIAKDRLEPVLLRRALGGAGTTIPLATAPSSPGSEDDARNATQHHRDEPDNGAPWDT